ncbi:MAG: biotin transporter BioY [Oscillospiraceae bacterium]|jgi:biotin transport system substrate-specific component|nr:biotin transporter BioY [Oscillospiraceae bacterium]
MKTRDIAATAVFAALICVAAPFSVPVGPIPLSLATLAVYLAGAILGTKRGTIAVAVYIALGAFGLPVFSGFSGGLQKLLGVTGGYIAGYLPCSAAVGVTIRAARGRTIGYAAGMVIGTILCYTLGTAWFMAQTGSKLGAAIALCVAPFLLGDAIKIAVATAVAPIIRRRLKL